jgi:hypothetical protein
VLFAVALTILFFAPLWTGGSLIGGDLFPYFFPQKAFLADELQAGRWPMWNPLTGHGYPVIAESQTGVCYPPDLVAYRFLSLTPAYNAIQIAHYIAAFIGTWLLARRLGAGVCGALLAATSFVYGWFPSRICLEWAIVTGAYLPWAMWCAESYPQRPRKRWLFGLCGLLTMQLLAGHFHLAFITQLLLAIYAPLRVWIGMSKTASRRDAESAEKDAESKRDSRQTNLPLFSVHSLRSLRLCARLAFSDCSSNTSRWLLIWLAVAVAFPLAAVQLAPTWELKQRSQRAEVSKEHLPGYGHLPPQYWSQVVAPWYWYSQPIDPALEKMRNFAGGAGTNAVEAHLYFGLLPLLLAVGGLIAGLRSRDESDRLLRLWLLLGIAFLLYTPGWFLPITQHLPGFSFFRGAGRYGIVTSLAVALSSGIVLSRLRFAGHPRTIISTLIIALTICDLSWVMGLTLLEPGRVMQRVGYSQMLPFPVVERRFDSQLRRQLQLEPQPVRVFAPMANVANLLDVAATPIYLGIGPAEYFDPQFTMPVGEQGNAPLNDDALLTWLDQAGVTHILSLQRLPTTRLPIELVWSGPDALLSPVFARPPQEPFYLYRLKHATGRAIFQNAADKTASVKVTAYAPHEVRLDVASANGGRVILRDLAYPGWQVHVDGQPRPAESHGMFRAVDVDPGTHEIVWTYHPPSVFWGASISIATFLGLLSASVLCRRQQMKSSSNA